MVFAHKSALSGDAAPTLSIAPTGSITLTDSTASTSPSVSVRPTKLVGSVASSASEESLEAVGHTELLHIELDPRAVPESAYMPNSDSNV
jgi:hypothetical protein